MTTWIRTHSPLSSGLVSTHCRYNKMYARELWRRKRFGDEGLMRFQQDEEPVIWEEGKKYTARELERLADQLLREDADVEMCRECGQSGQPTGVLEEEVFEEAKDKSGNALTVGFEQYRCDNGHEWYIGEGERKGINDKHAPAILFEEHFQSRKRREIYTTLGTPDPSIVAGIYNRVHPQGRKVNSEEQRRRNGASFYR